MRLSSIEQLGLNVNYTVEQRQYFDKLKAEFIALFAGRDYEEIKADEDAPKLKQISEKLAQIESFVKTKIIPSLAFEVDPASFLKAEGEINLPASRESLSAAEVFVVNMDSAAPVKILSVNGFVNLFGSMPVELKSQRTMSSFTLKQDIFDDNIIEVFGERTIEVSLGELWELLKQQGDGGSGYLLTGNNQSNCFYIRDMTKQLRVIQVIWDGGGWRLYVRTPSELRCFGTRIFSRLCSLWPSPDS